MSVQTDDRVARAQAKIEIRAAQAAAQRAERAARKDEDRRARAERAEELQLAREARVERRAERLAGLYTLGRHLRPIAPIVMVTVFAIYGQVGYGFEHYTSADTPWGLKALVAVCVAITLETVANTVAWYAHRALLAGATAEAAQRRYAAYAIALGVAAINYSHFSEGWSPTPGAVVFALFSAAQPWLWGMHTRREMHAVLVQEKRVDDAGAVFSSERWRAFPWRTLCARRYSIDRGVTDPREAWRGSEAERLARRAERKRKREQHEDAPPVEDAPDVEDDQVHDVDQLDDHGLSRMWETAPPATPAAEAGPASRVRSPFLESPPARAIELARQFGKDVLKREVLRECGVAITEYEAKELRKRYRTNGHHLEMS